MEVLSLAVIIGFFGLVGFGCTLWYHDVVLLTADDKYTVFLRKNWFWVIPFVSFSIGLITALVIIYGRT